MSSELIALASSALLWMALLMVAAAMAVQQLGLPYLLGPRDEQRPLTGRTARLARTLDNHVESLVLFTAAVVVATFAERTGPVTAACGWIYLAARVLYVPAYVLGLTPWRTVIWTAGFLATLVVLLAGLLGALAAP